MVRTWPEPLGAEAFAELLPGWVQELDRACGSHGPVRRRTPGVTEVLLRVVRHPGCTPLQRSVALHVAHRVGSVPMLRWFITRTPIVELDRVLRPATRAGHPRTPRPFEVSGTDPAGALAVAASWGPWSRVLVALDPRLPWAFAEAMVRAGLVPAWVLIDRPEQDVAAWRGRLTLVSALGPEGWAAQVPAPRGDRGSWARVVRCAPERDWHEAMRRLQRGIERVPSVRRALVRAFGPDDLDLAWAIVGARSVDATFRRSAARLLLAGRPSDATEGRSPVRRWALHRLAVDAAGARGTADDGDALWVAVARITDLAEAELAFWMTQVGRPDLSRLDALGDPGLTPLGQWRYSDWYEAPVPAEERGGRWEEAVRAALEHPHAPLPEVGRRLAWRVDPSWAVEVRHRAHGDAVPLLLLAGIWEHPTTVYRGTHFRSLSRRVLREEEAIVELAHVVRRADGGRAPGWLDGLSERVLTRVLRAMFPYAVVSRTGRISGFPEYRSWPRDRDADERALLAVAKRQLAVPLVSPGYLEWYLTEHEQWDCRWIGPGRHAYRTAERRRIHEARRAGGTYWLRPLPPAPRSWADRGGTGVLDHLVATVVTSRHWSRFITGHRGWRDEPGLLVALVTTVEEPQEREADDRGGDDREAVSRPGAAAGADDRDP